MFRYTTRTQRQASGQQVVNRKISFYLFPFTLSLLLSGCMVGPDYEKPEVDVPVEYRFEFGEAAEVANSAWWDRFNDPLLYELVDEALRNNRDVRIAAARVEEFTARVDIARSGLYPQFGYGGAASRSKVSLETGGVPEGISRTNDLYNAGINVGG